MKTQLLKSLPHVPLQKLRVEIQDTRHDDGTIEDVNAMGGEAPANVVENNEAAGDTVANFQYDRRDAANNAKDLGATSRAAEFFGKVFRKLAVKRHRNKYKRESSETVVQLTNYGKNENSESDSEENFQDGIPLVRRPQRI